MLLLQALASHEVFLLHLLAALSAALSLKQKLNDEPCLINAAAAAAAAAATAAEAEAEAEM